MRSPFENAQIMGGTKGGIVASALRKRYTRATCFRGGSPGKDPSEEGVVILGSAGSDSRRKGSQSNADRINGPTL